MRKGELLEEKWKHEKRRSTNLQRMLHAKLTLQVIFETINGFEMHCSSFLCVKCLILLSSIGGLCNPNLDHNHYSSPLLMKQNT